MSPADAALAEAIGLLADCTAEERAYALARLGDPALRALAEAWPAWAHDGQLPPDRAADGSDWRTWLNLAGRGFGKTKAGAEWVSALARAAGPGFRIALVGATLAEVEKVMVRGESGLFAVARCDEELVWYPSRGLLQFASGAEAFAYSGASPDSLRGPQHHAAWCDEIAKWAHPQAAWDNLMLGLRLGEWPRALVTTTPRPIPLLRRLIAAPATAVTRGRTRDNAMLAESFVGHVEELYGGTRLGRQELDGELIDEVEGALWTREMVERCRVSLPLPAREGPGVGASRRRADRSASPASSGLSLDPPPTPPLQGGELRRVVVGVDPPASANGTCGIVVCGVDRQGTGYVLADASVAGRSPDGWALEVVRAAEDWSADLVVAETNQGGDMVAATLRSADCALPVRPVRARFGKAKRAEPVAALFARGKARFAGAFPELEDELCGLTAGGGYEGPGSSPDRADAMVWAMAELMLGARAEPRVRGL